jgi:uncharacterized protein YndB with AHSA1/START domain
MNARTETQLISLEYDLPHPPAKVFEGAGKGWQRMVGELRELLARTA